MSLWISRCLPLPLLAAAQRSGQQRGKADAVLIDGGAMNQQPRGIFSELRFSRGVNLRAWETLSSELLL